MKSRVLLLCSATFLALGTASALAQTAEICGDGIDNDGDFFADEGCYPGLTSPLVDSPLSTADTGLISPSSGALFYSMPPDISARAPYGPSLAFTRRYVSLDSPGPTYPPNRKPLGDRWIYNYMSWISDHVDTITIHMPSGQEIQAKNLGSCNYEVHGGQAVKSFTHCSGASYVMTLLDRSSLTWEYNAGTPRLKTICDASVTQCVTLTYNGSNQVTDATEASGHRSLHMVYTSNLITSVELRIDGIAKHTTSYTYSGNNLANVTIGGQLAQQNVYTSDYLTQINDGAGKTLVKFSYDSVTAGKAVRVDTPRGMVGFEFASTRTGCSGTDKTVLYFNRGNTLSCSVDTDCGTGYLCGGKTGVGSTGQCFRGARCLSVDRTVGHHEDLVTSVTAIGPPGETCDGACLDISEYLWDNSTKYVASLGTLDPSSNYTVRTVNANGLPTEISFGDPDSISSNGNADRVVWLYYNDANFPGRVTELRRKSEFDTTNSCTKDSNVSCARTVTSYNGNNGKPGAVTQTGETETGPGFIDAYTYQTFYTYDSHQRLQQFDGPLGGSNDVIIFTYLDDPAQGLLDGFVRTIQRKRDATTFVTTQALDYDLRGNPTTLEGSDTDATHSSGSLTCLAFDDARGYLKERREMMAGQTSCGSPNAADLLTSYARDSALRLTQLTRPDGSCMIYEYDHTEIGRPIHLVRTKRRDDCLAASSGDRQEYLYDAEGLVTEVQTYDAAGVLAAKQPYTYFDSRKLDKILNPVDTSKWTGLTYQPNGLVSQVDEPGAFGKTVFHRDLLPGRDGRVTSEDHYKDATTFDTWNLLYDWLGDQFKVTDGDAKATETTRDDLGRVVQLISPDMTHPTIYLFTGAGQISEIRENHTGGTWLSHTFTYDNLNRLLTANYWGVCPTGTQHPEIIQEYDTPSTCPVGMTCSRTGGRLAHVKVTLMCSSAYADDGALDQETWYAYDEAGRVIREYIKDDSGRIADHLYSWTKNGALAQVTTPSSAILGATFGSVGSNSDTDRITAIWRTSTSTPIADAIQWFPYGPLKQYNQQNQISNKLQRTAVARNLAYRITSIAVENQSNGVDTFSALIAEDAKGRVTKRDYTGGATGVNDSYFLYDNENRVLCETTGLVSSCPTSGTNIKNSRTTPYFTNAGDWNMLLRPVPGSTGGLANSFDPTGYGSSHQVALVRQNDGSPAMGDTTISYDALGNRSFDDNTSTLTNDRRDYTYDGRHNVINVHGKYFTGGVWHDYDVASAFDARNRRVFKSFIDNTTLVQAQWFFYYDASDRLVEVRYTPNVASSTTYSVFQLIWLDHRLVAHWQTDNPSGTTSRRYVGTDESERPIDMWTWPSSGNGSRVWAIDPSAWGFDTNKIGPTVFQPVLFAGQYSDAETVSMVNGTTIHRPGLVSNRFRTYDPFVGAYLQPDRKVASTWSSYVYVASNPVGDIDPNGLETCTANADGTWDCDGDEQIEVSGEAPPIGPTGPGWPTGWHDLVCRMFPQFCTPGPGGVPPGGNGFGGNLGPITVTFTPKPPPVPPPGYHPVELPEGGIEFPPLTCQQQLFRDKQACAAILKANKALPGATVIYQTCLQTAQADLILCLAGGFN